MRNNYEHTTEQDVTHYHSALSFITNNNKTKYHKDSKKDSDYYKETTSISYSNTPSSNFKINSNHYVHLNYFSVVDGVIIEDSRGFVFNIGNANFIQLANDYICELNPKTYMHISPNYLKGTGSSCTDERVCINIADNEWFSVDFKFEDPLSVNF